MGFGATNGGGGRTRGGAGEVEFGAGAGSFSTGAAGRSVAPGGNVIRTVSFFGSFNSDILLLMQLHDATGTFLSGRAPGVNLQSYPASKS